MRLTINPVSDRLLCTEPHSVCVVLCLCAHTAGVYRCCWKQSCLSLPHFLPFCSILGNGEKELITACSETWPRAELFGGTGSEFPRVPPASGCQHQCCPWHSQTATPLLLPWLPSSQSTSTHLVQSIRDISLNIKRCTWIWNWSLGQMSVGAGFCSTVSTARGHRLSYPLSCHTPHQSCITTKQRLAPEISSSAHWNVCHASQWLRDCGFLQASQWCPGSVF